MSLNILMPPGMESQVSKVTEWITFRYTRAVTNPPKAAVFLMIKSFSQ